jgi:hypothetical protein
MAIPIVEGIKIYCHKLLIWYSSRCAAHLIVFCIVRLVLRLNSLKHEIHPKKTQMLSYTISYKQSPSALLAIYQDSVELLSKKIYGLA